MAGPAASARAVKRCAPLLLWACACGLFGQSRAGREADVRAEDREQEAYGRRETLTNDDEIEPFIVTYAGTDAARRAMVARSVDLQDASGCPAVNEFLERLGAAITEPRGRELGAEVRVRRAELWLGDCHDDERAADAAWDATVAAKDTPWLDDAWWAYGRALERVGRFDEALEAYDRIVRSRSDAWIFGSNDSLFLDDAWLAKGLLLERMGRFAEARKTLEDLLEARDTHLRSKAEEAVARLRNE